MSSRDKQWTVSAPHFEQTWLVGGRSDLKQDWKVALQPLCSRSSVGDYSRRAGRYRTKNCNETSAPSTAEAMSAALVCAIRRS